MTTTNTTTAPAPSALDSDSFGFLFAKDAPTILPMLRNILGGDIHAAEDALQTAAGVAWRAVGRFDPTRAPFGAWLRGIARRTAYAMMRKRQRDPVALLEDDEEGEATVAALAIAAPTSDALIARERNAAIADALSMLSAAQRDALTLHYRQGLRVRAIADRTGRSVESVKKDLQRGRAAMAAHVDDPADWTD